VPKVEGSGGGGLGCITNQNESPAVKQVRMNIASTKREAETSKKEDVNE